LRIGLFALGIELLGGVSPQQLPRALPKHAKQQHFRLVAHQLST